MFANVDLDGVDVQRQRVPESLQAVLQFLARGAAMSDDEETAICAVHGFLHDGVCGGEPGVETGASDYTLRFEVIEQSECRQLTPTRTAS